MPGPAALESLSRSPSGGPNFITVQFIYQHSFTVWADLQVASLFGNEQTLNYIVSHCKLAFNSDCNQFLFLPLCGPVSWPLKHLTAFLSIPTCKFNQPPVKSSCCHIWGVKQGASWHWVIFSGWYRNQPRFSQPPAKVNVAILKLIRHTAMNAQWCQRETEIGHALPCVSLLFLNRICPKCGLHELLQMVLPRVSKAYQ